MLQLPISLPAIFILGVATLLFGIIIGWLIATIGEPEVTKGKAKTIVGVAVVAVWIIATIADIFFAAYTVSPLIHALMGAIVGYFFTDDGINLDIIRGSE